MAETQPGAASITRRPPASSRVHPASRPRTDAAKQLLRPKNSATKRVRGRSYSSDDGHAVRHR